ncbi:Calponin-homology (CH) domain-containing protein [Caenorhabditis elegans]|uniref:Calponin-homology (CH) domain-containing protein n=1 Tax=Caenorhabditis elegans TaxID=6239 RepID=Q19816_CAEEL|nr:Calponin-homology (CH) domain-containing protein [Caenorhabditis elegans]CCD65753.1 Calponin-homology (CH) domain-containing protein [Caenorhabditis elegans]|eukprot:NP_498024.1 Uncharacterized protein CELE_F26F4.5 [Caenorhabditis elegans]
MSLFTRSLNRFGGSSSEGVPPNEQNITYRKKISAVSTSLQGDDGLVAASPRNCYARNNVISHRRRVFDEPDGATMSSPARTPVEQRAAEIRRMNSQTEANLHKERNHAPPPMPIEGLPPPTSQNQKKSRTSSSSLASVFRSRASSPIERMRKFIGRSSSKQPKEIVAASPPSTSTTPTPSSTDNHHIIEELEKVRNELAQTKLKLAEQNKQLHVVQKVHCSQQVDVIPVANVATMTENLIEEKRVESSSDKENVHPDIICIEDAGYKARIQDLQQEIAFLKREKSEQNEEFRQTRKDFILILKEAVLRKDEAERQLETISKSIYDEDDWVNLTSQHKNTLRRNVLLMWVQEKLELYSDQLTVSNFSSDWTDCRAFCALLYDLFPDTMPDVTVSPIVGDCISRCRRTFQLLEIPFDERALGISSPTADSGADEDSSSACSVITGLTDWRYIMNTVFMLYKRGVLGK